MDTAIVLCLQICPLWTLLSGTPHRPCQTPPCPEHPCPSTASLCRGNNGHAKVSYRICISSSMSWLAEEPRAHEYLLDSYRSADDPVKENVDLSLEISLFFSVTCLSN